MQENKIENLNQVIRQQEEIDCIIVDKVFASCQQRECFPELEVDMGETTFQDIVFSPGFLVPDTLIITDIEDRPNFRRARFSIRVPYTIIAADGTTIDTVLPDIQKDIIVFMPDARDEFEFRMVVETSSQVLGEPIQTGNTLAFAVGVFVIAKVVGTVQLLVQVLGYCPTPEDCEEFIPEDVCGDFDGVPFPEFFPPQLDDIPVGD